MEANLICQLHSQTDIYSALQKDNETQQYFEHQCFVAHSIALTYLSNTLNLT